MFILNSLEKIRKNAFQGEKLLMPFRIETKKETNFIFSTFYIKQEPETREIYYVHL